MCRHDASYSSSIAANSSNDDATGLMSVRLPASMRDRLKVPLGVLLPEGRAGRKEIREHLRGDPYIITVGDRTTHKMMGFGMIPCLQIIDGMEQRRERAPGGGGQLPMPPGSAELSVENPAAEITPESIDSIREALGMRPPVRLSVRGEEDLLVIPACIYAPGNAVVMYGQPNEGLVIVRVTPEIRNKARSLLDSME